MLMLVRTTLHRSQLQYGQCTQAFVTPDSDYSRTGSSIMPWGFIVHTGLHSIRLSIWAQDGGSYPKGISLGRLKSEEQSRLKPIE